jgi:hypothetical protein
MREFFSIFNQRNFTYTAQVMNLALSAAISQLVTLEGFCDLMYILSRFGPELGSYYGNKILNDCFSTRFFVLFSMQFQAHKNLANIEKIQLLVKLFFDVIWSSAINTITPIPIAVRR